MASVVLSSVPGRRYDYVITHLRFAACLALTMVVRLFAVPRSISYYGAACVVRMFVIGENYELSTSSLAMKRACSRLVLAKYRDTSSSGMCVRGSQVVSS